MEKHLSASVLVTDQGFGFVGDTQTFVSLDALPANDRDGLAVDLQPDSDPEELNGRLNAIDIIRIDFPSFADGRGLTIARRLRLMGFAGHLRAKGHVLADQYAMMRRAGFDDVEIDADLAARQPEDQWLARADWQEHDYQKRLRG